MINNVGDSLLNTCGKMGDLLRAGKANSLAEFSAPAHIVPIFLTDQSFANLPEAEAIIGGTLNYWCAFYLTAAQLSVNIGAINVRNQLDRLNNRRSPTNSAFGTLDKLLSMESFANGLPNLDKLANQNKFVMESHNSGPGFEVGSGGESSSTARGVVDRVEAAPKLSIGKIMEVQWESNGEKGTIVTTVKSSVQTTNNQSMVNILSIGTKNISFKERMHGIKSGKLDWLYDGILASDIIKDDRKAKIQDKTGYLRDSITRARRNKLSSILALNPSVATFSTVFFITEDTARELQLKAEINLDKFADRQKMFENSYGMVLVVVNPSWKNCKIYTHGLEDASTVSFAQMDGANKNKNGDIKELYNALVMNGQARF